MQTQLQKDYLKISPSDLNLFYQCPLKWKYQHEGVQGIPVDETARLFGIAIHNIIALYFNKISANIPDKPTEGEISYYLKLAIKEGYDPVLSMRDAKAKRILKNFLNFEKQRLKSWKIYKPEIVEQKLEVGPITGIIDFYGDGIIIDWKTGAEMDENNKYILRQGTIYKILLEKHKKPVRKILFVFLDSGKTIELPPTTEGWVVNEIKQMLDMIKLNRFPAKPSPLCAYCPFILRCQFRNSCIWWEL